MTWQAYNIWGGRSLYKNTAGSFAGRSYAVSYDRPYDHALWGAPIAFGFDIPVIELTKRLALLAREAGLDGVVAGGSEIEMIREICGRDFLIVTPGVRLEDKKDDQKRTITPQEAIRMKEPRYGETGEICSGLQGPKVNFA